ncbi:MAG: hypothetical protein M3512_15530 [Bacteroidota bacterium]|nr:hypothetical protein [Bacteroidota bacterium]
MKSCYKHVSTYLPTNPCKGPYKITLTNTFFTYSPASGLLLIGLVICLSVTQIRCESGNRPEELEKEVSASAETGPGPWPYKRAVQNNIIPSRGMLFNKIDRIQTLIFKGRQRKDQKDN